MNASTDEYAGRLRIRVCGLLVKEQSLLLAELRSPVTGEMIWTPPGGGVNFGESVVEALVREFREETGLEVKVGDLKYIHELKEGYFQAIEFYFVITEANGKLHLGDDPERHEDGQILKSLKYIPLDQLVKYNVAPRGLIAAINEPGLSETQVHFLSQED